MEPQRYKACRKKAWMVDDSVVPDSTVQVAQSRRVYVVVQKLKSPYKPVEGEKVQTDARVLRIDARTHEPLEPSPVKCTAIRRTHAHRVDLHIWVPELHEKQVYFHRVVCFAYHTCFHKIGPSLIDFLGTGLVIRQPPLSSERHFSITFRTHSRFV